MVGAFERLIVVFGLSDGLLAEPGIKRRQDKQCQQGSRDQATDYHRCQGLLDLGTGAGAQRHRNKPQTRNKGCHHDWSQALHGSHIGRLLPGHPRADQILDRTDHDQAIENSDA